MNVKRNKKKFKVINPRPGIKSINLVGNRFGMLIVTSYSHLDKHKNKIWNCLCDCGVTTQVSTIRLRQGSISSCNCNQHKTGAGVHNFSGYEDITGTKWNSIKYNAISRGLVFEITKEDVWECYLIQGKRCELSDLPVSFKDNTASVDRKDNAIGYTKNNIQIVHKDINIMRNKFSMYYFIKICMAIAQNYYKRF